MHIFTGFTTFSNQPRVTCSAYISVFIFRNDIFLQIGIFLFDGNEFNVYLYVSRTWQFLHEKLYKNNEKFHRSGFFLSSKIIFNINNEQRLFLLVTYTFCVEYVEIDTILCVCSITVFLHFLTIVVCCILYIPYKFYTLLSAAK